ncbi:MAG: glycosyltransferase [Chloroflexi bacterium]|nr:glycosyltransferase [Chloroflexota bacterium]
MKILFLTPRVPYPLDGGTNLRNFRLLQSAALEHEVHLLSFLDRPLGTTDFEVVEQVCRRVELRPAPPHRRLQRLERTVSSPLPDMAFRRWSRGYVDILETMLRDERYDLVQAEGIEMARYLPLSRGVHRIFSEHNVEYLLQERAYRVDRAHPRRWPLAAYSLLQARRLARFEQAACRLADAVLTVSENDARSLRGLEPRGRYAVVPNAIDPDAYPRRAGWPDRPTLLLTGTFDYRPNTDAVRWLLDTILPAVHVERPDTRVFVAGRAPSPDVVARGQHDPRIVVTGGVPSLDAYWRRATVYVLPMRGGGGTRFKVLEAMAAGLPIVSTRLGMEGIAAIDGVHYLAADDAPTFAAAVLRLLDDAPLRERIAEAASALVREQYDWRVVAPRLLDVYRTVVREAA